MRKALSANNIALVSVFAGFIAASTLWGGIPIGSVPVTLQTLAVVLAGACLGAWRGAAAVVLYLVVGTAGAPIFAGHVGGPAVWASPTAGFLAGFVAAAFATGVIVERLRKHGALTFAGILGACAVGSLVVLNLIGWTYLAFKVGLSFQETIVAASPFVIGDIIKVFIAAAVATAVHRAYPQLLGTSATVASAPVVEGEKSVVTA